MLKTFAQFLADRGIILEGWAPTQSQFSTNYTAWLTSVFSNADVQSWMANNYGYTLSSPITVQLNQNGSLLPTVNGITNNLMYEALFGDKIDLSVKTGSTSQARSYVKDFEQELMETLYGPKNTVPTTPLSVDEDQPLSIPGLSVADADSATLTVTLTVTNGTLSVDGKDPASTLTLTGSKAAINAALSTLKYQGDANYFGSDTLTITTSDGTYTDSDRINITVTPVNDAPEVSAPVTGSATEDGASSTLSALENVTDVDTALADLIVTLGTLPDGVSYNAGTKSFTLDPKHAAFQSLAKDQPTTVTVEYTVSDGIADPVAHSMSWTVTGTNDAAVIGGDVDGEVTEAGADAGDPTVTGTLTAADVDNDDNVFQIATDVATTYGKFSINAAGEWTYTLDDTKSAVQALNDGDEPLTDTFTVKSIDGTEQEITVKINGANDAAVIGGTKSGTVVEATSANAGTPTFEGQLTATDVDNDDDVFQVATDVATTYGKFSIDATGKWVYTLDNNNSAVNALNNGQHLDDTFTVYSADNTAQVISVRINGATDVVAPPPPPPNTAPTNLTFLPTQTGNNLDLGMFTAFDADVGDSLAFRLVNWTNTSVTATVASSGALSFSNSNESFSGVLTVAVSDREAASVQRSFNIVVGSNQDNTNLTSTPDTTPVTDGSDIMAGRGGGDILSGSSGDDFILGGNGNDALNGGAGNDRLLGGGGTDTLTGGLGDDWFMFRPGDSATGANRDIITDFTKGADKLVFDVDTSATLPALSYVNSGVNAVVTVAGIGDILLNNVNFANQADLTDNVLWI